MSWYGRPTTTAPREAALAGERAEVVQDREREVEHLLLVALARRLRDGHRAAAPGRGAAHLGGEVGVVRRADVPPPRRRAVAPE